MKVNVFYEISSFLEICEFAFIYLNKSNMAEKKLTLDSEGCIGCGMCINLSSMKDGDDVFVWWDNNKAQIDRQPEDEQEWKWVKQDVIPGCPVDVIQIEE